MDAFSTGVASACGSLTLINGEDGSYNKYEEGANDFFVDPSGLTNLYISSAGAKTFEYMSVEKVNEITTSTSEENKNFELELLDTRKEKCETTPTSIIITCAKVYNAAGLWSNEVRNVISYGGDQHKKVNNNFNKRCKPLLLPWVNMRSHY